MKIWQILFSLFQNGFPKRVDSLLWEKPHVYKQQPVSLKNIQIQSVIFLACNYFYIIYRSVRVEGLNSVYLSYVRLWMRLKKNIYLGPDE